MNPDALTPRIDRFVASARGFQDWPINPDIFLAGDDRVDLKLEK
jgi:hypothetical protein